MSLLSRLGLRRPEHRAWAMYDWANSSFTTTIITAIFPVYFTAVAAAGQSPADATRRLAAATTVALTISAILAPVLGALADYAPIKKRLLGIFMVVGVLASAGLALVQEGQWLAAALLFAVGNIGFAGSLTFYDSLLPHIASDEEMDRVSTSGYALGYLGGGILLAINVATILAPGAFGLRDAGQASRLSFFTVAVWWLLFSIPLFRSVPEPRITLDGRGRSTGALVAAAFRGLVHTLRELTRYKHALLLLLAYIAYSDGINTIIRMATSYGTEIGLERGALITAILLVQFVGIPFAFLFGQLAGWIGAKTAVFLSLAVYTLISVMGYYMKTERDFYVLAAMVAAVQGGSQALSRSLYSFLIPPGQEAEYFSLYEISDKGTSWLGPLFLGLTLQWTGSFRLAILSLVVFFLAGLALLSRVDARRAALAAGNAPPPLG